MAVDLIRAAPCSPFLLLGDSTMEPSWKQADVFPIIARIIEHAYREHQRWITAPEIAVRLLEDTAGRNLVEAAHEQQEEKQSVEWLASNMVSWFNQRITVGESDWVRAFERTKIAGFWAYKPVAVANS
jgi:hypothetical protein